MPINNKQQLPTIRMTYRQLRAIDDNIFAIIVKFKQARKQQAESAATDSIHAHNIETAVFDEIPQRSLQERINNFLSKGEV